jgi:hypothetical protein
MNAGRDVQRLISGWLEEEAPTRAPDRILTSAAHVIDNTKQRRAWRAPWRLPMNPAIRVAAIALVAIVAVAAAISLVRLPSSSVGAPAASPVSVEGEWDVTFDRAAMLQAGLADAAEDNPGNYGHFTLSLHGGSYKLFQVTAPNASDSGTYTVEDGVFTMNTKTGEKFSYPYTVSGTTLTFGAGGPVTMRVKPWTRVGP